MFVNDAVVAADKSKKKGFSYQLNYYANELEGNWKKKLTGKAENFLFINVITISVEVGRRLRHFV